jgi:tungstate transport system ATP-binding protein
MLPLCLDDITYRANGRELIRGISATIDAGPRTIILGANGAGKSLLLRLCHGLIPPTSGGIRWSGDGRQAMVFQRPVLLRRSAFENIVYALSLAGVRGDQGAERALESLRRFGLEALARRPARVLSGGEQQRLALARAWALAPRVLFLDEPTANLDPNATRHVEAAIGEFHAAGAKIIMTTHNLGQARRMGDEILFLAEGRLVERRPAIEFFGDPQSAEAREYLRGELP